MELGETPEPGGLDGFDAGPPTPLPLLGRGIPHQRRATLPAGSVGHGGQYERGSVCAVKTCRSSTRQLPTRYMFVVGEERDVCRRRHLGRGEPDIVIGRESSGTYDGADCGAPI